MNVEQLNSRIATVNAEAKRLNNQRQTNIGRRAELSSQLTKALTHYEETYGVKLTVDGLEEEMTRVSQLKEQEVSKIENVLALINEGRYEEAKALCEGDNTAVEQEVVSSEVAETVAQVSTPVVQEPVYTAPVVSQPVAQPTVAQPTVAQPVAQPVQISEPVAEAPAAPIASPVINQSSEAVASPIQNNGFFTEPITPQTGLSGLDVAPAAPPSFPNLGTPASPTTSQPLSGLGSIPAPPPTRKNPTSFGTILQGGQPFTP